MKIYVASSWRNQQQPEVVRVLREAGHSVYDFHNPRHDDNGFGWKQVTDEPPPWSAEKTREVLRHPVAERGYGFDKEAMLWADTCVMVQPCGRSAYEEFGWFCGRGKRAIALLADAQEPELMIKLGDHICVSMEEVLAVLKTVLPSSLRIGQRVEFTSLSPQAKQSRVSGIVESVIEQGRKHSVSAQVGKLTSGNSYEWLYDETAESYAIKILDEQSGQDEGERVAK